MSEETNNLEFCENCGSIYTYLNKSNYLVYHCRKCSHQKECNKNIINTSKYFKSKDDFNIKPNPNMIYNNTLQRTKKIECPHCKTNTEIVYYKAYFYDLTLVYICTECKNYWHH
jgi:DNA-directed RNA polymerase subunit M/transcription elongation factor TFIIS